MRTYIAIAAVLVMLPVAQVAGAGSVPSWFKDNADAWSQDIISQDVFIQGIQYLITEQVIEIPPTEAAGQASTSVPGWFKETSQAWALGIIDEAEFLGAIQYLVTNGIITLGVPADSHGQAASSGSEIESLYGELEACAEISKAYKRLDCEKAAEEAITVYEYKRDAQPIQVGPISYYWKGIGSEGNSLETSESGQALLNIRMLAENTSSDRVALNCTSPQICSYDITDGSTEFKYSATDFTSGQIVLNPGGVAEFNMLFGPNIGYGGTQFVYDPARDYHFRISEGFGGAQVPLDLS